MITGLLTHQLALGTLRVGHFYLRRVLRLAPVYLATLVACLAGAWVLHFPSEFEDFSQSLTAAVLGLSNVLFWRELGYFTPAAETRPMLHTWSLAVEAQYYLVMPWLLLGCLRPARFHTRRVIAG